MIAVDIIDIENIDIRSKSSRNEISKICQVSHDVEDQLDMCWHVQSIR